MKAERIENWRTYGSSKAAAERALCKRHLFEIAEAFGHKPAWAWFNGNRMFGEHATMEAARRLAATVIQGDFRRGIPDRAIGDTPPILDAPAGQEVGQLSAGTSYTVVRLRRGYALLRGTRYSKPFAPGQTVGWVRAADVHYLALRNCN